MKGLSTRPLWVPLVMLVVPASVPVPDCRVNVTDGVASAPVVTVLPN